MGDTYIYTTYAGEETYIDAAELTFKGLWVTATSYVAFDVVDFVTAKYVALQSSSSTPPSGNLSEYWSVITKKYYPTPEPDPAAPTIVEIIVGGAGTTVYTPPIFKVNGTVYMTQVGSTTDGWLSSADYNALFYVDPSITSFTNNIGTVEVGTSVASVTLAWTLNKTVTTQTVTPGGSVTPGTTTLIEAGPWTATQAFGLTVGDGTSTTSASTTASFSNKRYWGVNANTSLDDAAIIALSSEFAASRAVSKTIASAGQYIYVCYPAAWGTASFTVNGLPNTAWTLAVQSFTNASGYISSYNVYKSDNVLTGTYIIAVS